MKIRTDFVTNSSSSSFVLEVVICTKTGKCIRFSDYSIENEKEFCVTASPRQLALSKNIDELIALLKKKVLPYGENSNTFINQIRNIPSIEMIKSIAIRGDESNYIDYNRTYVYDCVTGEYQCEIGGHPFEKDGSSGGDLIFDDWTLASEVSNLSMITETSATSEIAFDEPYVMDDGTKLIVPEAMKVFNYSTVRGGFWEICLERVKEIVFSSKIEEIGTELVGRFHFPNIEKITVENNKKFEVADGALIDKSNEILLLYFDKSITEYTIPSNVKTIETNAFNGCSALKHIYISEQVTKIRPRAFSNCRNLMMHVYENSYAHRYAEKNKKKFEFITSEKTNSSYLLGKNVVLSGFLNHEKSYIASIIQEKGGVLKPSVSAKTDILIWDTKYPEDNSKLSKAKELIDKGQAIEILSDVEFYSKMCIEDNSFGAISNEQLVDGHLIITNIEKIPENAYKNRSDIVSVEFVGYVMEIGDGAFEGCTSLKKVSFNNLIRKIGSRCFANAPQLEQIQINSNYSFEVVNSCLVEKATRCAIHYFGHEEQQYLITNEIKSIGSFAFADAKFKELMFFHPIDSIEQYAFSDCKNLGKVIFSDKIRSIQKYAFSSCDKLENISFFNLGSEINIEPMAFEKCENIVLQAFENDFLKKYADDFDIPFEMLN